VGTSDTQHAASLHVGDRIVTRHMLGGISPGSGTIVGIFGTAPGFYDVRMDEVSACHVIHVSEIERLHERTVGAASR
jgi:hypothetical protein